MAAKTKTPKVIVTDTDGQFVELRVAEPPPTAEPLTAEGVDPADEIEPGAPGFHWQSEYPGEKMFVYTAADGTTVGLAAMVGPRKPKAGFLRQLRKEPAMEQMWTILEIVMSPAALAVSDEFEDEDYSGMYAAWSEWSKTAVGESTR